MMEIVSSSNELAKTERTIALWVPILYTINFANIWLWRDIQYRSIFEKFETLKVSTRERIVFAWNRFFFFFFKSRSEKLLRYKRWMRDYLRKVCSSFVNTEQSARDVETRI